MRVLRSLKEYLRQRKEVSSQESECRSNQKNVKPSLTFECGVVTESQGSGIIEVEIRFLKIDGKTRRRKLGTTSLGKSWILYLRRQQSNKGNGDTFGTFRA